MASTSSLLFGSSFSHPSLSITGSDATRALWLKNRDVPKEYCNKISMQHNWKPSYKCIDRGSTSDDKSKRKFYINATPAQSHDYEAQGYATQSIWKSSKDIMHTLQKFAISYYLITMLMSIISTSLLAVENISDISPKFFVALFKFIIPMVFMYFYAIGINQLADLEIDKINKPYRPLASGKISYKAGVIFTISCFIMSFGLGWMTKSKPLPLLRWKKSTILTLASNVPSMLIGSNVAPFLHMKASVFKKTIIFPRSTVFTFVVMSFYYFVIMLLKDIPDIEGDKAAGLQTLSVRLGPKRVFWLCVSLLAMAYGVAIVMGVTSPCLWSKIFTVLTHSIMALVFWYRANSVDLKNKDDSQSFYMLLYKLLSVENILIHFVR